MRHLDQFIALTKKPPVNWTSQDIQNYFEYLKAHSEMSNTTNKIAKNNSL
jgi:hypothetical protein